MAHVCATINLQANHEAVTQFDLGVRTYSENVDIGMAGMPVCSLPPRNTSTACLL